jgi:TonB family protein
MIAIVLLLGALTLVLVKDREFWFGSDETPAADEEQPVSSPVTAAQTPAAAPVATPAKHVSSKHSAHATLVTTTNRTSQPASAATVSAASQWGPATSAAQRVAITAAKVEQPADSSYPLLAGQMSVQGSVLLQALIAADGAVEDMRVLSGPTILVQAAREAVRQWRFKPYLENGKPVETQARVTVNFTIKVSNNTARYQPVSITSDGAL